jgi:hypothetical protein
VGLTAGMKTVKTMAATRARSHDDAAHGLISTSRVPVLSMTTS